MPFYCKVIDMNHSTMKKTNQYEIIPVVIDYIAKKIHPKNIILFGSCANRMVIPHSAIDLSIIKKKMYKCIPSNLPVLR